MAFTLAYLASPVPAIPDPAARPGQRPPDRREHFGTEEAAMRRARQMFPAADWLDLRLYGPDGRLLAGQAVIAERLDVDNPSPAEALTADQTEEPP